MIPEPAVVPAERTPGLAGKRRWPAIAEGSGLSALAQVVRSVVGLVSVPLTVGYLGREAYGLWMVTLSVLTVLTVVDAGLSPAAKNRMAQAFAVQDVAAFRRYTSVTLVLAAFLAVAGMAVVAVVAAIDWAGALALSDPNARAQARGLVVSAVAMAFASFSLAGVEAIYAARLRIGTVAAASIGASLVSLALLGACTAARAPLWTFPVATVGPTVLARAALLLRLWREDPEQISCALGRMPELLKELLPASAAFVAIQGASVVASAAPNVLLATYRGVDSVTVFSVAYQLVSAPLMLIAAVMPAYWPAFTMAWTRREIPQLKDGLRRAVALTVAALVAYVGALSVWGGAVSLAWTRGAVQVPRATLVVLGGWLVAQGVAHWLGTFLNAISDLRAHVACTAMQAVVLLCATPVLARAAGASGVAAAMLVAALLALTVPLSFRVRQRLRDAAS